MSAAPWIQRGITSLEGSTEPHELGAVDLLEERLDALATYVLGTSTLGCPWLLPELGHGEGSFPSSHPSLLGTEQCGLCWSPELMTCGVCDVPTPVLCLSCLILGSSLAWLAVKPPLSLIL